MAESGGAEYLISIFGTEKDRVNCPFYFKIGACRHGDKCTRRHNRPTLSQTILFVNLWDNPVLKKPYNPKLAEEDFEDFCEDIFLELMKYGEIEDLYICDNISEHMVGNVYCKYRSEDDAAKAMVGLTGRFYNGKAVVAEYSPVTDFREASCRQYEHNECTRGGFCNFIHAKNIPPELRRGLFREQRYYGRELHKEKRGRDGDRSRDSRRKERPRSRERDEKRRRTRSRSPRDRREREQSHEKTVEIRM